MKETKTTFAYLIEHMIEPSFEKVRSIACDFIRKLPDKLVNELHEMLNRGIDILESEPLMQMYLYSYGCMHAEKLAYAFKNLSNYIRSSKEIDLIDYGCGQGLATMCYHDFISDNGIHQQVRSIKLIEPSPIALARAELLCASFFPNAVITPIHKPLDELLVTDIQGDGDIPIIHLFSNILDVESFNVKTLSNTLVRSFNGDNEIVIVSPMLNASRRARLKEFVDNLGINCYLEKYIDKYQLREDRDWTCSALLCSTRNEKFATINLDAVYNRFEELLDDVTKRRNKEYSKEIFNEVKFCADNGVPKCINMVGLCYLSGVGVEKNYSEALRFFEIAARLGFPPAFSNISRLYARGMGTEKNPDKAISIIKENLPDTHILYNRALGYIYRYNNKTLAFEYFKKAAELGDPMSEFYCGYYLYFEKVASNQRELGVQYLQRAATKGYAQANYLMARFYELGEETFGIKQSDALAFENYKTAAIKGNTRAQLKLAEIYKTGLLGVNKNLKESFRWYLFLAENGDKSVAFNVAYSYATGNGTDVNDIEAVKWYKIAADYGSVAAMNNLAVCYENGRGVEKDLEVAFSLYYKSACYGNTIAANNLSCCYQHGTGTEVNPEEAFNWKKKAALSNNHKAQKTLAKWYFKGYGTCRNYEKALYWYVISKCDHENKLENINDVISYIKSKASENNAFFQYLLAKCYDRGVGVPVDKSCAKLWYETSANNNFIESYIKLRRINDLSTEITKEETESGNKDEFGVLYSSDWKKILSCSYVSSKQYKIRQGTRIIADGAFDRQNIEKIIIPSSVIKIGANPFKRSIPYNNNSRKIENYSPNFIINGCTLYSKDMSLMISYWGDEKQFVIPENVKHIAPECFIDSRNLEDVVYPEGLESIGRCAFMDSDSLYSIDIPKSVKYIGEGAFFGCEHLEYVWSLGSIELMEPKTFKGCNLRFIHLPASLRRIGDEAFNSNNELKSVELPDAVEALGNACFSYCRKLECINLGEAIHTIGNFCFYETSIQEIRLPSSLIKLGTRPFDNVKKIITKSNSRFLCDRGMLIDTRLKNLVYYFGDESTLMLNNIESISPFAFYKSSIENVVIPDSVKIISEYAFYSASKLKYISLPSKLQIIETGVFCGCESLENITVPDTVKEIKSSAFAGCLSLKHIHLKGAKTEFSKSIIKEIFRPVIPFSYHSNHATIGSLFNFSSCDEDIDSMEVITIFAPKSTKVNNTLEHVYSEWEGNPMNRRFEVIQSDEYC